MHIFIKVGGRLRGERLSYLSMYLLLFYDSLPIIFSLATLVRLRFSLHLEMQACNSTALFKTIVVSVVGVSVLGGP